MSRMIPTSPSRRHFLGFAGLVGVSALAGCTSGNVPGRPRRERVDVRRFGAKGDGRTDDLGALRKAFEAVRPGQSLVFPADHVFCHSSALALRTPNVHLVGPGTIRATREESSALMIEAPQTQLDGLSLDIAATTHRGSAAEHHKLYLGPHSGIVVRDVTITGSAAAGLYSYGASDFRIESIRVRNTRADGVHLTNGSRRGTVDRPHIGRSGDDGVAVVSYLQDPTPCSHIEVIEPTVDVTTGGRGVSVVGGHDVSYRDIDITASSAAAVYIACEGGDFVTHPTERVSVSGGTIARANTDAAIDHGAVLVYSGRRDGGVRHVTVRDLQVSATRSSASRQIGVVVGGDGDGVDDIVFSDLRLGAAPEPYQGNAPRASFRLGDVTAAGKPVRVQA